MFANPHTPVTLATSDPLFFLDDAVDQLINSSWPKIDKHDDPVWEAMRQKRADKSASNLAVRTLLEAATAGGMAHKDFEIAAGNLRPNTSTHSENGFNGMLWHNYMKTPARMSLLAFIEYAQYFHNKGWLNSHDFESAANYSAKKIDALAVVKKMFPPGVQPDWEIDRTARTYRTKRS